MLGATTLLLGMAGHYNGAMKNRNGHTPETIAQAAAHLRAGEPVVFPTDTVMGLGVAVGPASSPQQLYDIKGRERTKAIAWLVGSADALSAYGANVPDYAFDLAREFWPGPLTLVVEASPQVPEAFQSPEGTIGLRMPSQEAALALVEAAGCPLATTSANVSGAAAPGGSQLVDAVLREAAAFVLEGGEQATGRASTVIDCTGERPAMLREGDITRCHLAARGYTF